MTRYLNQDLVRQHNDGKIHQLYYPDALVDYDEVDWEDRITLHKDPENGKLVVITKPNKKEKFISFPIATDYYYLRTSVLRKISKLAIKYKLENVVSPNLFPRMSLIQLESMDVPLSDLDERVKYVFGKEERSIKDRYFEVENDLKGVSYNKINLGKLLKGRLHKIGEYFPYKTPTFFALSVRDNNILPNYRLKGEEEYKKYDDISEEITEIERERVSIQIKINELQNKYDNLNNDQEIPI